MSIPLPSEPSEPSAGNLQFDQAEFNAEAPGQPTCGGCKTPIADQYYEASGQLICPACRGRFENAMSGGSGLRRSLKALILGLIAAMIGSVAYYAIEHATGYNIGLVAIVLGILIGGAVKMGSESRGGWFYQVMALFLTYTAIAAMHIPDIIIGAHQLWKHEVIEARDAENNKAAPPIVAGENEAPAANANAETPNQPAENAAPKAEPDISPDDPEVVHAQGEPEPPPTVAELFLVIGALCVFAYALPIFIATEAPISGLIYAFALWEAWKLNKRTEVVFNGPYSLAIRDSDEPEGVDHGV